MSAGYKEDLRIDKFGLDIEAEQQPSLYMEWAEHSANAIFARDKAKERLEFIIADLDAEIRINWDIHCPNQKLTESGVSSWIKRQSLFQETSAALHEATRQMNILLGAKEAFNHRKDSLKILKELSIAGYYSKPTVSTESAYKAGKAADARSSAALAENERIKAAAARRRPVEVMTEDTTK
jgi:hypothetical protein